MASAWTPKKSSAPSAITWPEALRITRLPSISEPQFLGCAEAFLDSLGGELNAASLALRRLLGARKGSAFAYEMALDAHRYGALIVLDRWSLLIEAFGAHLQLGAQRAIAEQAPARIAAAEKVLAHANRLLDAADAYSAEVVEACVLAFRTVNQTFEEEREAVQRVNALGPPLPEEYRQARAIFQEDLAAR